VYPDRDAGELLTLAEELADIGPHGWTLEGTGEVLTASRRETQRYGSAVGRDAGHLLAEVRAAEARLEENQARVASAGVAVTQGVANTHTMRPLRAD
jgi:hypothetical protein